MTAGYDKHMETLRVRLVLLEGTLIPQARAERHECIDMWLEERDALVWAIGALTAAGAS